MKRFLRGCGRHRDSFFIGSILCAAVFFTGGCTAEGNRATQALPQQSVDTGMGTIVSQTVYAAEDGSITEEILQVITDLEQNLLSWRLDTSEVYAINAQAGRQEGITLSQEMADILDRCMEVSRASEGAFDITIGEAVRLWDIDTWAGMDASWGYELPGEEQLAAAMRSTGYEKLELQGDTLFLPSEMQLDLGAVGKGIALTRVQAYLEGKDTVAGAVISVGGSVLTYGKKPDGTAWRVGIVNPEDTSENLGYLSLSGQWCVSTSGDYERYVLVDGIRYHHILDPATGYPADSGLSSVTILTKDGLWSDALSTACFILGEEAGRKLAVQFSAEALFVDHDGNISMTDGMEEYFHLSK